MRKLLLGFLLIALVPLMRAQTGVVSATVVDSDGTVWIGGAYTIKSVYGSGGGTVITTGVLNGSGSLSML